MVQTDKRANRLTKYSTLQSEKYAPGCWRNNPPRGRRSSWPVRAASRECAGRRWSWSRSGARGICRRRSCRRSGDWTRCSGSGKRFLEAAVAILMPGRLFSVLLHGGLDGVCEGKCKGWTMEKRILMSFQIQVEVRIVGKLLSR